MRRPLIVIVAFVLFSFDLSYAMKVEVEPALATQIARLFPGRSNLGFTCQQPLKFSQNISHCEILCKKKAYCREQCQSMPISTFLVQAEKCGSGDLEIVSTLGWLIKIKEKSQFTLGQTWIEEFITGLDYFIEPTGTFKLQRITPQNRIWVDENGEERTLEVLSFTWSFRQSEEMASTDFELEIDRNETGLAQLLYFGKSIQKEYFIQRWGLLR